MSPISFYIAIVIALMSIFTLIFLARKLKTIRQRLSAKDAIIEEYKIRFSDYFDVDEECKKLISDTENERNRIEFDATQRLAKINDDVFKAEHTKSEIETDIQSIRDSYRSKKEIYDNLVRQLAIYNEDFELAELGFYQPHFDFDASEKFKEKILDNRDKQKNILKNKGISSAIYCSTEWTVGGSRAEGKKLATRAINITARAFNNECDAAIANCTWKNATAMEERIRKAFDAINKLNETNQVHISRNYLALKLEELRLTHEFRQKKQQEKEEQRELRAQMAEEKRVQMEIERAIREAEAEEERYERALDKARKDLAKASAEQRAKYEEQISKLEAEIKEAEEKGQRALSMAQQTRRGHVYIISNIGSFGEDVYKIGMTRRLDPQDRIDELGSASVPFLFDIHAMIRSEDAPTLEKALHDRFDSHRVNAVNRRKEFFNASLNEIKAAVTEFAGNDVDFVETAVAKDYYETKVMREQELIKSGSQDGKKVTNTKIPEFADAI